VAISMQWDVRVVLLGWMLGPILFVLLLDGLSELEGRFFVSTRCCNRRSSFLGHRRPQRLPSRGRGANALPPRKMVVVKRRRTNSVISRIHILTRTRLRTHMLIPIRNCSNTDTGIPSIQMMRIRPLMARATARMVSRWVVRCRWRVLCGSCRKVLQIPSLPRWRSHCVVAAAATGGGGCFVSGY